MRSKRRLASLAPPLLAAAALAGLAVAVAVNRDDDRPAVPGAATTTGFVLDSPLLDEGRPMLVMFTCHGADRSPPLRWRGVPTAARSLAIVVEDPDAPDGTFTHWLAWDIAPDAGSLPVGVPKRGRLDRPLHLLQGENSFGDVGWGGPCPPAGAPHHYGFRLLALDDRPALAAGSSVAEAREAFDGHVVAEARMVRSYPP